MINQLTRTLCFFLLLVTKARCANILGLFMFPSVSHQIVFQPIWKELSLRGHNVTVVTPNPLKNKILTNLTEISLDFTYVRLKDDSTVQEKIQKNQSLFYNIKRSMEIFDEVTALELESSSFRDLMKDKSLHFDVILAELHLIFVYGLRHQFKAPLILVSSFTTFISIHGAIGNFIHPVLYPDMLIPASYKTMSFWDKILATIGNLFIVKNFEYFLGNQHKFAQKYIDENVPDDLLQDISFSLLNLNHILYSPRPYAPNCMEMGQMHIKPVKTLPEDLEVILDEASDGVVYFSLGTNVRISGLSQSLQEIIIKILGTLPYTVLWKCDYDNLPNKPDNVVMRKWFPQQDLLAHPNVKIFVTQAGLQSIEESITMGVPLLCIPFIVDQLSNAVEIADWGMGLALDYEKLTEQELFESIVEIAGNPKYRERVRQIRRILYDKPMTGLEKAIWWTEYIIRHKGNKYLKSPNVEASWFEVFMVDIILIVFLASFPFLYFCYQLFKHCIKRIV